MNINSNLRTKLSALSGRKATAQEIAKLRQQFSASSIQKIVDIVAEYPVIGYDFSLPEYQDSSGIGVDMRWLSADESIEEATEFYPGIAAMNCSYFPVGKCLEGSGDPYFVDINSKELVVVRIPHDAVTGELLLSREQVEVVSSTILRFFELSLDNAQEQ